MRKPIPPAVLILEKSPFWSAELSRQFLDEPISIRMRSEIREVVPLLTSGTVNLLLIGLEIDLPAILRLLTELRQKSPQVQTLVMLPTENLDLEWSLRELGACEIIPTPVSGDRLKQLVDRRLNGPASSEIKTSQHSEFYYE